MWLQNQRDQNSERSRSGGLAPRGRDLEIHEFKVGLIKHERVKVPRGDEVLLDWAIQVCWKTKLTEQAVSSLVIRTVLMGCNLAGCEKSIRKIFLYFI